MKTLQENLSLAIKICQEVNQQVISSNDIIAEANLPHCYAHEIDKYKAQFGSGRVELYLHYQAYLKTIRENIFQQVYQLGNAYLPIASIAITQFGVGEYQEMAWLTYYSTTH